jgi:hypothetical protein
MKKILTLILCVALATPTFAQFNGGKHSRYNHSDTEHYYGLRLGVNSAVLNSDQAEMDMNARAGLAFGAVYGLQLANSTPLWLEAGLMYSEKGGRTDILGEKVTCRLTYLEVPVVIKYGFDVADDMYIEPFLGGYFALGVGGKIKEYRTRTSEDSFSRVNRPDAGIRLGCGIEYMMVYAEFGFEFGLANINKSNDFDSVRNQSLFFNIGVNF